MYLLSAFLFSVRRALIPSCRAGLWALWMAGVAVMAGCANTSPPPGVKAVTPFDLQRYQGAGMSWPGSTTHSSAV